eukprot:Rhum_TRINITY_DN8535_c0_g2::Rhum_TRINITY_DN8535_c0_g2_i1::g.28581::m.28581
MEVSCSGCDARVTSTDKFCRNCGEGLILSGVRTPDGGSPEELCHYARRLAEYSRALRQAEPLVGKAPPVPGPPSADAGPSAAAQAWARPLPFAAPAGGPARPLSPSRAGSVAAAPSPSYASSAEIQRLARHVQAASPLRAAGPSTLAMQPAPTPSRLLNAAALSQLRSMSLGKGAPGRGGIPLPAP